MGTMTIGEAAARAGVSAKAIRLYEARGLLAPAERSASGHRLFTEHDIAELRFIARGKIAGLRLRDIKTVLELQRAGKTPCQHVRTALDERAKELDQILTELTTLRRRIAALQMHAQSGSQETGFCSIISGASAVQDSSQHPRTT